MISQALRATGRTAERGAGKEKTDGRQRTAIEERTATVWFCCAVGTAEAREKTCRTHERRRAHILTMTAGKTENFYSTQSR